MEKKFLPIGSVVRLKNVAKDLMIIGYSYISNFGDKIYDYGSCFYPEGSLSAKSTIAFDHDKIEKVLFVGLKNDDFNKFMDSKKTSLSDNVNRYSRVNTFDFNDKFGEN